MNTFLISALMCVSTQIINNTDKWTDQDERNLTWAKKRCYTKFADAPCLKKFYKIGTRRYYAICGGK
mgnify:CR=1 FL=1